MIAGDGMGGKEKDTCSCKTRGGRGYVWFIEASILRIEQVDILIYLFPHTHHYFAKKGGGTLKTGRTVKE